MVAGRTRAQRDTLIRELTETTIRVLGVPAPSVQVILTDIERDHWGVGGVSKAAAAAAPSQADTAV